MDRPPSRRMVSQHVTAVELTAWIKEIFCLGQWNKPEHRHGIQFRVPVDPGRNNARSSPSQEAGTAGGPRSGLWTNSPLRQSLASGTGHAIPERRPAWLAKGLPMLRKQGHTNFVAGTLYTQNKASAQMQPLGMSRPRGQARSCHFPILDPFSRRMHQDLALRQALASGTRHGMPAGKTGGT